MKPEEELADLQRKYQLLEGDRKAYYETSQWTIKQNRETIAALKRENKELRGTLATNRAAGGSKPQSDGSLPGEEELAKLRNFVAELRKQYDTMHNMTQSKFNELNKHLDGIRDLEKDSVRASDDDSPMMRHIRMLENRLDKALIKFNEAQSIRRTYDQIVKRLREERIGFDNQLAAIERTLKAKEHDLEELILMSHDANHAKEVAKAELAKVDSVLNAERAARDKDLADRRQQVRARQEMNARMQQRDAARIDIQLEAQGDLSQKQEEALKKSVVTNQLYHEMNKRQLDEEEQRVTTFEEAFKKIKEATGVSDVSEVIQKFMTQEDTHNNLKQINEEAQARIDHLKEEKAQIQAKLEELKYAGSGLDGSRKLVDEYEGKLAEATAQCEKARMKYEKVAKILVAMKAGIAHLRDKLEVMQLDEPTIQLTDETVVDVVAQAEKKLMKTLALFGSDDESVKQTMEMVNSTPSTELPVHNSRIETKNVTQHDSDEEDSEDYGSDVEDAMDVPDRGYVKNSSQQLSDKTGKKGKRKVMKGDAPGSPATDMKGKVSRGQRPSFE